MENSITIEGLKKITSVAQDNNVAIFGAGLIGQIVCQELINKKINVVAYCDNSKEKQGGKIGGIPVFKIEDFLSEHRHAVFIVAVSRYKDVFVQLQDAGCDKIYNSIEIIKSIKEKNLGEWTTSEIEESVQAYERHLVEVQLEDEIVLPNVGLVITQKCSLKCRDCSNLMQYYKNPIDYAYLPTIRAVDRLLKFIDRIERISVIGGEPFLNKELHKVIEWLSMQEKIHNITIFTNGTFVPSKEILKACKNDKVFVSISDYGEFSKSIDKLVKLFKLENVKFAVAKSPYWVDMGNLKPRGISKETADELFRKCWHEGHTELMDGQLHYCSRSSGGAFLGIYEDDPNGFVDLLDEDIDDELLEKKFRSFIANKTKAPTACFYCDGRTWTSKQVPVAIQVSSPLEV